MKLLKKIAQKTPEYPINYTQLHLEQISLILEKEEQEYKN